MAVRDSFELASLASSSSSRRDNDRSSSSPSSRGLSPMSSRGSFHLDNSGQRQNDDGILQEEPMMIPLSASSDLVGDTAPPLESQKRMTMVNGLALVIGLQIGSGIFASPGTVLANVGSVGATLIVWLVSGLLAWTGAASYAELGTAIPLNGGAQCYLQYVMGPLMAFLYSWTAIVVLKPGGAAIIAITFGEYMNRVLFQTSRPPEWANKLVASLGILVVMVINCLSTRWTTRAGTVFLIIKIGALLAITVIGFVYLITNYGDPELSSSLAPNGDGIWDGTSHNVGNFAIALYAGLWAFDGWDNVNYVVAEMKQPERDVPRVVHLSMPIVIICFLAANAGYFTVLSKEKIASSNTVALVFGRAVFGSIGGIIFAGCVAASCLGALNATTFTSARLIYAAARQGFLPNLFGTINKRTQTPVNALVLQAIMGVCYVLVGSFDTLLTFYGVSGFLFYFLTVLSLIVLRVKDPQLHRPYKVWLSTPILFCCVALFLISRGIFEAPISALCALGFIICGIPIYIWRGNVKLSNVGVIRWILDHVKRPSSTRHNLRQTHMPLPQMEEQQL